MKRTKMVIILCIVFATDTFAQTKPVTVYTAGRYISDNVVKPCYWQGTTRIDLPVPAGTVNSHVAAIAIYGGTVYAAGYYDDKACYWQGTEIIDLPVPAETEFSYVNSIAIVGGTVYAGGGYSTECFPDRSDKKSTACYWQGTKRIDLPVPVGIERSYVNSLAIANEIVYAGGHYLDNPYNDYSTACYWQGAERIDLPVPEGTYTSEVLSIAISNGTIYAVGYHASYSTNGRTACYWQGTTRFDLPVPEEESSIATSLVISDETVYVAGDYVIKIWDFLVPYAFYWDGVARNVLNMEFKGFTNNFTTSSIAVAHGTVYVAGYWWYPNNDGHSLVCYWQGTTRIDLPIPENGKKAITTSIVLVE